VKKERQDLDDTELVIMAQEGDVSAFEAIYDRHLSGVTRVLASYAGPDRDALDDLTQDVFYRVIDRIGSYVPRRPFSHWLYTIALNVGRNHTRQRSKFVVLDPTEFDGISNEREEPPKWPEELVEVTLMRMVTGLPDHMREVVSLRVGSGMSYGEIAEVLGIPEGTARSRMHGAVAILRAQMSGEQSKKETR
jgi:RNA polymerase sigma-70 factor (ECF subfamily)